MSASAVPGYGKMPTLAAPADGAPGAAVMAANLEKALKVKNRSSSYADWAAKVIQQAYDWASTV